MQNITKPLRLAVGSHAAGSGRGCAMNVISWENGDSEITDLPGCADPMLARVVQRVNDTHCTHTQGGLLCPECSVVVLALAHRTVGTALDLPAADRARVYVTLAVEQAESVLHLTTDDRARAACALVRRFLAGEDVAPAELRNNAAYAAADAAANAAYAAYAAANAANAAAHAANAAANAVANAAADAAADADAASDADAADADAAADRLDRAHRLIDRFEALSGVRARPVPEDVTREAVAAMVRAPRNVVRFPGQRES